MRREPSVQELEARASQRKPQQTPSTPVSERASRIRAIVPSFVHAYVHACVSGEGVEGLIRQEEGAYTSRKLRSMIISPDEVNTSPAICSRWIIQIQGTQCIGSP